MDSKYHNIAKEIDSQSKAFGIYLRDFLLGKEIWEKLMEISSQSEVYIFSGVIRNFLLGYIENRDLDIVIRHIKDIKLSRDLFSLLAIKKNSFGGYKIRIDNLTIDVWGLEDTWGIVKERKAPTPQELIKTAFFNFSAIVYDVTNSRFIYSDDFCRFMKTKVLDVVYPVNPNIPLCIVSTLYYIEKYNLWLSYKLCRWIAEHYKRNLDFVSAQKRHFGKPQFTNEEIEQFAQFCKKTSNLPKFR